MADDSGPKKRGWYPHRYGDEGMQSYWDGSGWTGESRPKRSMSLGSIKGAFGWVLLAIGINFAAAVISPGDSITPIDWVLFAASTTAWLVAAVKARSCLGRGILWFLVIGQALVWIVAFQLVGSTGLAINLGVGNCFDNPESVEVMLVDTVSCDQPHDNEVFALKSIGDALGPSYPIQSAIEEFAVFACLNSFDTYVGESYQDSILDITWLQPTSESWAEGDRTIICTLYRLDQQKMTGSMQGSGF